MFRILIAFLILFVSSRANGQMGRYTVWDFRDSLMTTGIDSIIIYSKECTGETMFILDSCDWQEPYYLIWQSNNKFYLKKFNQCNRYKVLEFDSLNVYATYFKNKSIIDKEEIKPPTYEHYLKKGNRRKKHVTTVEADNDCFDNFWLLSNGMATEKKVSRFSLTNKDSDKSKNIYYNLNQKTKLKQLIHAMDDLITLLESSQKFKVE